MSVCLFLEALEQFSGLGCIGNRLGNSWNFGNVKDLEPGGGLTLNPLNHDIFEPCEQLNSRWLIAESLTDDC